MIPRIGTFLPSLAHAILDHFEQEGIYSLNSSSAITLSRNKVESLQRLQRGGISVPRTVFVQDLDQVRRAIEEVGGAPVVIKPLEGTQWRGVILAESEEGAASVLESLLHLRRELIVQECFSEVRGRPRWPVPPAS